MTNTHEIGGREELRKKETEIKAGVFKDHLSCQETENGFDGAKVTGEPSVYGSDTTIPFDVKGIVELKTVSQGEGKEQTMIKIDTVKAKDAGIVEIRVPTTISAAGVEREVTLVYTFDKDGEIRKDDSN